MYKTFMILGTLAAVGNAIMCAFDHNQTGFVGWTVAAILFAGRVYDNNKERT